MHLQHSYFQIPESKKFDLNRPNGVSFQKSTILSRLHLCAHSLLTIGEALSCNYGNQRWIHFDSVLLSSCSVWVRLWSSYLFLSWDTNGIKVWDALVCTFFDHHMQVALRWGDHRLVKLTLPFSQCICDIPIQEELFFYSK